MPEISSKIRILDPVVANKIAAGEVVERPASVVKELVENAIDAGATRLDIEIEEGGKRLIRVVDNGCGMSQEDAILALQRHATSKISAAEDLYHIHTLGFRGEALPSIAAVSQMTLTTREAEASAGVQIVIEGGIVSDFKPVGCPPGTAIEVRNLFFNTPARLKFLKTSNTEIGHIIDHLSRFSLFYHQISFRLRHNSHDVLVAPATDEMRHALVTIYGKEVAREMIPLELAAGTVRIYGYIGKPTLARSNRNFQAFFVNGRSVQSRVLQHALYEGYHTLLLSGRHPIAVVVLEIDPQLVDVNVHPAKAEVRFTRDWEVHNLLQRAVREALEQAQLVGSRGVRTEHLAEPAVPSPAPLNPEPEAERPPAPVSPPVQDFSAQRGEAGGLKAELPEENDTRLPQRITPLAQIKNSYILAETDEGLLIIDQHAAHERILYEQMQARRGSERMRSQLLVIPFTLQCSPREARAVEEHLTALQELGFQIEPFGRDAFLVRGIPLPLAKQRYEQILRDLIDELVATATVQGLSRHQDDLLRLMSCKAAIKAGEALAPQEIDALLGQLRQATMPFACNHGRPTMIRITEEELERLFKRK